MQEEDKKNSEIETENIVENDIGIINQDEYMNTTSVDENDIGIVNQDEYMNDTSVGEDDIGISRQNDYIDSSSVIGDEKEVNNGPIDEFDTDYVDDNDGADADDSEGADNSEELKSSTKNALITVDDENYAVGLFWQTLQDAEDAENEIREAAETIAEGSDLFCVREGATQQYALGESGLIKPGMKVAGTAVAEAFSDKPSSVAVFKVPEGWWFIAMRNDLILADDDKLFINEEDAKQAFFEMMAVPDWGRKIAPPEWNIYGSTYIELSDILRRSVALKLSKIGTGKNLKKIWMGVAVAVVLLYGIIKFIDMITAPPPPPVYKPLPQIKKKAAKQIKEEPPPWTKINKPVGVLEDCYVAIKQMEGIAIPGWEKIGINCNVSEKSGSVSSNWKRQDGRIAWFSDALTTLDLTKDYKSNIANSGASGTISSSFADIKKENSPPNLSGKDIRLQLLDVFDAIGVKITFGTATEGEVKDPKNPKARPRPKYFLVKFKFTTEYQPETWMDVLSQFSALTVTTINYDVAKKIWSYEGKIYERRI